MLVYGRHFEVVSIVFSGNSHEDSRDNKLLVRPSDMLNMSMTILCGSCISEGGNLICHQGNMSSHIDWMVRLVYPIIVGNSELQYLQGVSIVCQYDDVMVKAVFWVRMIASLYQRVIVLIWIVLTCLLGLW